MSHQPRATLASNLGWLGGSDLASRALQFAAAVYLSRTVSQEAFGAWSVALSMLAFGSLFADLGADMTGVRELAHQSGRVGSLVRGIVALKGGYALGAVVLLLAAAWLAPVPPRVTTLVAILGVAVVAQWWNLSWVFRGLERMAAPSLANLAGSAVFLLVVLASVSHDGHLWRVAWAHVAGTLTGTAILLLFLPRQLRLDAWRGPTANVRVLARESLPLGASFLLVVVLQHFGTLLVGMWCPEAEVGLYGAALRTMALVSGLAAILLDAMFPVIARLMREPVALARVQRLWARFLVAVAVPLAAGGSMVASPLVSSLFGPGYAAAGGPLAALLWAAALALVNNVCARVIVAGGRSRQYFAIVAVQAAVFLVALLPLTHAFGALGAAVALTAGEALGLVLYPIAARRLVRTPLLRASAVPLLAAVPMLILLQVSASLHVAVRVLLGGLVYCATFLLLRGLTFGELRELLMQARGRSVRDDERSVTAA